VNDYRDTPRRSEWLAHWLSFGKPLDPENRRGAVMLGSEHQITGATTGLPDDVADKCSLSSLFQNVVESVYAIDEANRDSGAFIGRPALINGDLYALFIRVQALPEKGKGAGGRSFTQISALAIEAHTWTPDLIEVAYYNLFDTALSKPVKWSKDGPKIREPLRLRALSDRPSNWARKIKALASVEPSHRSPLQIDSADLSLCVQFLSRYFDHQDLEGEAGAALPFCMGVDSGILGGGDGYFMRTLTQPARTPDMRPEEMKDVPFPRSVMSWAVVDEDAYRWRRFWGLRDVSPPASLVALLKLSQSEPSDEQAKKLFKKLELMPVGQEFPAGLSWAVVFRHISAQNLWENQDDGAYFGLGSQPMPIFTNCPVSEQEIIPLLSEHLERSNEIG